MAWEDVNSNPLADVREAMTDWVEHAEMEVDYELPDGATATRKGRSFRAPTQQERVLHHIGKGLLTEEQAREMLGNHWPTEYEQKPAPVMPTRRLTAPPVWNVYNYIQPTAVSRERMERIARLTEEQQRRLVQILTERNSPCLRTH